MTSPDGMVSHAELKIGDSVLFVFDEFTDMPAAPATGGLPPTSLFMYVEDVDAVFSRAVAAGCRADMPVINMFCGDHYGKVTDPYGYQRGIAMHVEDGAPDEMERRTTEWMTKMRSMAKSAGQD